MRTSITTLMIVAAMTGPAIAAEAPDPDRRELSVGVGAGRAYNEFDEPFDEFGDSLAFDGRLGYRLHRHVGVEAVVQYLHGFEASSPHKDRFGAPSGTRDVTLRSIATTVNAKGYPFTGMVQPYVVIGMGAGWFEEEMTGPLTGSDTTTEFVFRGGVGLDLRVRSHVTLYVEATYLGATGDFDGSGTIPLVVGAQYRF